MPVLSHIFVLSPLLTLLGPGYGHSPRKYTVEHSDENLSPFGQRPKAGIPGDEGCGKVTLTCV